MTPFADLTLARRLERAEAEANARFVEARAELFPDSGAGWITVAGAYAMFDGVDSPCTQTFGLGMEQPATANDLSRIETFFSERGAPIFHETCPIAHQGLLALLVGRDYAPVEYSSVLYRTIGPNDPFPGATDPATTAREVARSEAVDWAALSAEGWSEFTEYASAIRGLAEITVARRDGASFIAEHGGVPIATGALCLFGGVALLAGASTIPTARRRGAQLALLGTRLRYAVERGCDLAMMVAAPGSGSQRNAERHGFRLAYTRIKWRKRQ